MSLGWMDGSSMNSMNVSLEEKKKDTQEIVLVLKHPKKVNRDFQLSFFGFNRTTEPETSSWAYLFRFWINTAFLNDSIPIR